MTVGELLDRFDSDPELNSLADEPEVRSLRQRDESELLEPEDLEPISELLTRVGARISEELSRLAEIDIELGTLADD